MKQEDLIFAIKSMISDDAEGMLNDDGVDEDTALETATYICNFLVSELDVKMLMSWDFHIEFGVCDYCKDAQPEVITYCGASLCNQCFPLHRKYGCTKCEGGSDD